MGGQGTSQESYGSYSCSLQLSRCVPSKAGEQIMHEYSKNLRVRTYIFLSAANKVLIFSGNFWQFRLSRFLISIKETRLLTPRKIKKFDFGLYINMYSIYSQLYLAILLYARSMKPVIVLFVNLFLLLEFQ